MAEHARRYLNRWRRDLEKYGSTNNTENTQGYTGYKSNVEVLWKLETTDGSIRQ